MIFCHRPEDPFYRFVAPEGVTENPLNYRCAPNAADPSYAGASTIEAFIAYGFRTCWLSPNDFTLWWRLERHDIQWLREYFLRVLEDSLLLWYEEGHDWELPCTDFGDVSNDANLNVGNSDEGEDEEVMLRWVPEQMADDVFAMSLDCAVMASATPNATGGEPVTIWLDREAIEDRSRVRTAIAWARKANALPGVQAEDGHLSEIWDNLDAPLVVIGAQPTSFETFRQLYEKAADGTS